MSEELAAIYDLLYRLGVTANYTGFFHTAYAVSLCVEQPERLLLVTKRLYPEVAKQHRTKWQAVERNIRTVGDIIWRENRSLLEQLARRPLARKPRNAQLLAILAASLNGSPPVCGAGEAAAAKGGAKEPIRSIASAEADGTGQGRHFRHISCVRTLRLPETGVSSNGDTPVFTMKAQIWTAGKLPIGHFEKNVRRKRTIPVVTYRPQPELLTVFGLLTGSLACGGTSPVNSALGNSASCSLPDPVFTLRPAEPIPPPCGRPSAYPPRKAFWRSP